MRYEKNTEWARAPVCFSCGKDIGSDPADVIYLGYGHRHDGQGPGWVASLCSCEDMGADHGSPSPCVEVAQDFAAEDGAPLSPEEYQRWLATA